MAASVEMPTDGSTTRTCEDALMSPDDNTDSVSATSDDNNNVDELN